jgi:hypothetical protein
LPVPPPPGEIPPVFLDVDGDDWLKPLDVLIVINDLNAHSVRSVPFDVGPSGSGEAGSAEGEAWNGWLSSELGTPTGLAPTGVAAVRFATADGDPIAAPRHEPPRIGASSASPRFPRPARRTADDTLCDWETLLDTLAEDVAVRGPRYVVA